MADQLTFDLALPPPNYTREEFIVGNGNREALGWIGRASCRERVYGLV